MKFMTAAVAALVASPLLPALPAHATPAPSRVLIVGDSVTQGRDGDYSWRYFAWQRLAAGSVDFVGPRRGTYLDADAWGGSYADPNFDQDHAARWGQAMWQPLDFPDDRSPAIGDLVAAHDPDVIVEALGINDIAWAQMSAQRMSDQLRRFVAQARAVKPDVDVVLGGVPQEWIGDAGAYNDVLPGLAAELSTDESRVVAASVPVFVEGVDTWDFAHPSRPGEEKLGASYADAIASLIAAPVPTPIPTLGPTTGPAPVPAPTQPAPAPTPPDATPSTPAAMPVAGAPRKVRAVRTAPRRIVVTWRAGTQVEHYVIRCGRVAKTSTGRRAVLRARAATCSVRSVNAAGVSVWVKVRVRS
ncbi:GDSL-type esterase/lipase family protein [Nocardioides sp. STR2]|uniref:GDSL-type esterase/lipase family protein n=1 Tax=Nocardioides pini TaxID=2975053 RepID=A0ABT4CB77_9ACTN|nr:GDSL-type esterase/lipase family protein [Nocardioides pini]MCY4726220.1 GDSL-type esterase/lipase family protein [Nocardioides pini]